MLLESIPHVESSIQVLIDERVSAVTQVERTIFTGRYKLAKSDRELFATHSISIIYSFWEGYIQQAFGLYVDHINSLNLNMNTLEDSIRVMGMESLFKQFINYPTILNKKIKFYDLLYAHYSLNNHKLNRFINTESNVSFEVLNKILINFCLTPLPEFWRDYRYPRANLKDTMTTFLRYRNSVVHGGDITSEDILSQEVFNKYKNLIFDLMYEIKDKIIEGANTKSYLKIRS